MTEYIKQWLEIIENMNNDNTYKLAWGRALLELIVQLKEVKELNSFTFQDIGHKMLKYYWNQTYFFDLKQSPDSETIPVIVQETNVCISYYKKQTNSSIPVWFDKAEEVLEQDPSFYHKRLNKIASTLKNDVSWRFMKCKKKSFPLYLLDRENRTVTFTKAQVLDLKEFAFVLSELLNFRWAQLLEKFNHSPRIALKVKGISEEKIRRKSLSKYKDFLLAQMEDNKAVDFYTGKDLKENDISVDHVIPWSFMYSDDIWNLVLTSKSENSSKSNSIPSLDTIHRLEDRNKNLLHCIHEDCSYYGDLKTAVDHDYVQKFYLSMKM